MGPATETLSISNRMAIKAYITFMLRKYKNNLTHFFFFCKFLLDESGRCLDLSAKQEIQKIGQLKLHLFFSEFLYQKSWASEIRIQLYELVKLLGPMKNRTKWQKI